MTFHEAENFLLTLPRFDLAGKLAMKPGLERIRALLAGMGAPQDGQEIIQVAGTNGKGSTASMLAAMLTAGGTRVGLHTSPHLLHLGERMRVDGVPAPQEWIADAVTRHRELIADVAPSFFEATVALSVLFFAEMKVDFAVVEVGLGGRLDATSALDPMLSLITHIALDHTDLLGDTLAEIATEKAGIARAGVPLLTSVESGPALDAIKGEAGNRGAAFEAIHETCDVSVKEDEAGKLILDLITPKHTYEGLELGLRGRHQTWNAALAVRAAERIDGFEPSQKSIRTALGEPARWAGIRGRCELLQRDPIIAADVAHNPDGIAAALRWFRGFDVAERHVALAMMRDKDLGQVSEMLRGEFVVHPLEIDSERALDAESLGDELRRAGVNVSSGGRVSEVAGRFAASAEGAGLLVTGSHLAVADLLASRPT